MSLTARPFEHFAFLTLPNYSMIAFANALEACRMANYVAGRTHYRWDVVTLDGAPAEASNGLTIRPTAPVWEAKGFDILVVVGGIDVRTAFDRRLIDLLHRLWRQGMAMGALCTGTFALAEAGMLDDHRAAIHWENLNAIREEFPRVSFVDDLFVIDRDRITCTGGVAPLEMMLTLIEARLGADLARKVGDEFIVERVRPATDRQVARLLGQQGIRHPVLETVARQMQETLEAPLDADALAAAAGVSVRQLQRLFKQHLGHGPARLYTTMRLDRARELLRLTGMSVTEIALAVGYPSTAPFSTAYRARFGHSPSRERA